MTAEHVHDVLPAIDAAGLHLAAGDQAEQQHDPTSTPLP